MSYSLLLGTLLTLSSAQRMDAPQSAAIIETTIHQGVVVGQRRARSVTAEVSEDDVKLVELDRGKVSEDAEKRKELYLFFAAQQEPGGKGLLGFRVWVEPKKEPAGEIIKLDSAKLRKDLKGWEVTFTASGVGVLKFEPFWAQSDRMSKTWKTFPNSGLRDPIEVEMLNTTPLAIGVSPQSFELTGVQRAMVAKLEVDAPSLMRDVGRCYDLLDSLARSLGTKDKPYLWKSESITIDSVAEASLDPVDEEDRVSVRISPDSGEEVGTGLFDFVPLVRMRLGLVDAGGKITGAEIALGIDPLN